MQVFFLYFFVTKRRKLQADTRYVAPTEALPSVTLVIPCWNESETIDATMQSVQNLDYPQDKLHTILIDDGSTDNTCEILQKYKGSEHVTVLTKKNGGKHTALNFALDFVQTELFCSIDADTFLEPDALTRANAYFVRNPELSAVGGAVLIHKPRTFAQKAQSIEYQMFAYTKKVLGLLDGVMVAPGAFSVYRTDVLKKIGGYKKAHNMEDLELTLRLQTSGYKVDQCHNGVVYTKGPDTVRALYKQRLRWGYGFLQNAIDYRQSFFNKSLGNFGLFTMPTTLFAYFVVLVTFFVSWFKVFQGLVQNITIAKFTGEGLGLFSGFSFDLFFVNTQAIMILTILAYATLLVAIYLGRRISSVKGGSYINFLWFFILYSIVVPFWIIKSVYNTVLASTPSWR